MLDARRAVLVTGVAASVLLVIGVTGDTSLNEGYSHDGNYVSWMPCVQHGSKDNVSWTVSSATLCLALLAGLLCASSTFACHGCGCKAGCGCCQAGCDVKCRLTNSLVSAWCFAAVALALYSLELVVYGSAVSQCRLCHGFELGSNYTGSLDVAHCWAGEANLTSSNGTPFRYETRCSLDDGTCSPTLLYSAPLGINIVATSFGVVAMLLTIPALLLSEEAVGAARTPASQLAAWERPHGMMPPGLQVVGIPVASRDVLLTAVVRRAGGEEQAAAPAAPAAAPSPAPPPSQAAAPASPPSLAPPPSPLTPGVRVLIERLDVDGRLNGQMAVVMRLDGEEAEVTLVASGEQRRLPIDRLRLLPVDLLHI